MDREVKKVQIVPQTKIAFVGVVLLLIVQIVIAVTNPVQGMMIIPMLIMQALVFLISLYAINCTVVGKCHLYAWIMSYLFVVLGLIAVILLLFKIYTN